MKCYEEYIVYLSFIGSDLIKLIKRSSGSETELADKFNWRQIKAEDLLQFLLNSLPKILFNIILPVDVVPPQYRASAM